MLTSVHVQKAATSITIWADLCSSYLTLRRIMSISEYFIPFTRIGISLKRSIRLLFHSYNSIFTPLPSQCPTNFKCVSTYWTKWPDRASLQIGCSARVSQNSQASRATFSSGSWVRCSMYCRERRMGDNTDEDRTKDAFYFCVTWSPALTWMMLCMCGMRRSMRTSRSMTRALHTFFRTSLSSSPANANRLWSTGREKEERCSSPMTLKTAWTVSEWWQKNMWREKGTADDPDRITSVETELLTQTKQMSTPKKKWHDLCSPQ